MPLLPITQFSNPCADNTGTKSRAPVICWNWKVCYRPAKIRNPPLWFKGGGEKAETETLISHFSQSIPILGNERKVTDGVLIGLGNQVLNLAKDACNRLSYSLYFLQIVLEPFVRLYVVLCWCFSEYLYGKREILVTKLFFCFFFTISPLQQPVVTVSMKAVGTHKCFAVQESNWRFGLEK